MAITATKIQPGICGLREWLASGSAADVARVPEFVAQLMETAVDQSASDMHIEPTRDEVQLRVRIDGVLQPLATAPKAIGPNIVARFKVLAGLLTYETAVPQEGRIREIAAGLEFRVSTFPTIFGERVVVRVLGRGDGQLLRLRDLGLPTPLCDTLQSALRETSGGVIIAGPAGSGKTTTAYACLREIVEASNAGRSIASLEDPVEVVVPGVAQSQVNAAAGFDMATGLRSLLRQDPEVMLIGEIRDRTTAEIALQAALTGQLVITTFHAGSCVEAIHRLIDMGLPGYAVRNAIRLIVAQRLMRQLCACAIESDPKVEARPIGLDVAHCRMPTGCDRCRETGYQGRVLIAESLSLDEPQVRAALTEGGHAIPNGLLTNKGDDLWAAAEALVDAGVTSPAEAIRVLGFAPAV